MTSQTRQSAEIKCRNEARLGVQAGGQDIVREEVEGHFRLEDDKVG